MYSHCPKESKNMVEMSRMKCMDSENTIKSVSSSTVKRDLTDITPPPSPEKKFYQSVNSEKKIICSGSATFSVEESGVFQTSSTHKIQKNIEYLLNYLENGNSVKSKISNKDSNLFPTDNHKKNVFQTNPFKQNLNFKNSIHYNRNNPFLPLIQDEQNNESNILFYDSCILCSSSSCKAMNYILYENARDAFSFEQNNLEKVIGSFTPKSMSKDINDKSSSKEQIQDQTSFTFIDDSIIFEDEFESSTNTVPFSSVSIFELPKDNVSLDTESDWYISSDDEFLTENQNAKNKNKNSSHQYINTSSEKINTRQTKKQYPKLSVNSKYVCTDTQSVYESPKTFNPKPDYSFEKETKIQNSYTNEFKSKNKESFYYGLNNTKCDKYDISQKKIEKSIIIKDSFCEKNTYNEKRSNINNTSNHFYTEPFIGSVFIDNFSPGTHSKNNNDINNNQSKNYGHNTFNQNCQKPNSLNRNPNYIDVLSKNEITDQFNYNTQSNLPNSINLSNAYNPNSFVVENNNRLLQNINNPNIIGDWRILPNSLSNIHHNNNIGYNFYPIGVFQSNTLHNLQLTYNQKNFQGLPNNNTVPQAYNNKYYPAAGSLNNNFIRTTPSLKSKMTINDYVNRARLAQMNQSQSLESEPAKYY